MSEIRVDEIVNEEGIGPPNFPLGVDGIDITPIGGYVMIQTDLTGAEEPDPNTHIKLEAGLTSVGDYNEGKLDNESVTGSAPLVEATAEIVDSESPLNGQTVHLLNTEHRYLMPGGSPGAMANDHMEDHFHRQARAGADYEQSGGSTGRYVFNETIGLFPITTNVSTEGSQGRVSDHTNVKHIEASVYMRIK